MNAKFNEWLETFLEEKDLPLACWEFEDPLGRVHIIDSEIVVEHIKIASDADQFQIQRTIIQIDLHNGNVNHFFQHLAKGIVSTYDK